MSEPHLYEVTMRLRLTAREINSLDRMVVSSGDGTRTRFVNELVREICADEMNDRAGEKAA